MGKGRWSASQPEIRWAVRHAMSMQKRWACASLSMPVWEQWLYMLPGQEWNSRTWNLSQARKVDSTSDFSCTKLGHCSAVTSVPEMPSHSDRFSVLWTLVTGVFVFLVRIIYYWLWRVSALLAGFSILPSLSQQRWRALKSPAKCYYSSNSIEILTPLICLGRSSTVLDHLWTVYGGYPSQMPNRWRSPQLACISHYLTTTPLRIWVWLCPRQRMAELSSCFLGKKLPLLAQQVFSEPASEVTPTFQN